MGGISRDINPTLGVDWGSRFEGVKDTDDNGSDILDEVIDYTENDLATLKAEIEDNVSTDTEVEANKKKINQQRYAAYSINKDPARWTNRDVETFNGIKMTPDNFLAEAKRRNPDLQNITTPYAMVFALLQKKGFLEEGVSLTPSSSRDSAEETKKFQALIRYQYSDASSAYNSATAAQTDYENLTIDGIIGGGTLKSLLDVDLNAFGSRDFDTKLPKENIEWEDIDFGDDTDTDQDGTNNNQDQEEEEEILPVTDNSDVEGLSQRYINQITQLPNMKLRDSGIDTPGPDQQNYRPQKIKLKFSKAIKTPDSNYLLIPGTILGSDAGEEVYAIEVNELNVYLSTHQQTEITRTTLQSFLVESSGDGLLRAPDGTEFGNLKGKNINTTQRPKVDLDRSNPQ